MVLITHYDFELHQMNMETASFFLNMNLAIKSLYIVHSRDVARPRF